MSTDIDPNEAIATVVINAIHLRGFDTVMVLAPDNDPYPKAMDLTEFAYWLRDAIKDLDAVMGAVA